MGDEGQIINFVEEEKDMVSFYFELSFDSYSQRVISKVR